MLLGTFFKSLCHFGGKHAKSRGRQAEPKGPLDAPALETPLALQPNDGWDRRITNSKEIRDVRQQDNRIERVGYDVARLEKIGNAVAGFDNSSPSDTNPAPGVVDVKDADIPASLQGYDHLSSVHIEFDDQHRIVQADVTYNNKVLSSGEGGGIDRYQYEMTPDGRQVFTNTNTGMVARGPYNTLTPWEHQNVYTVEPDGSIRYSKDEPGKPAIPAPGPPAAPAPVEGPLSIKLQQGWDQQADDRVSRLKTDVQQIEEVANAVAGLDNGEKDHHAAPGVVLLEGSDLPEGLSKRIGSAMIAFDGQEIKEADIRYNNTLCYDGTGGGQDRYQLRTEADGTHVFTEISDGTTMEGWNNHFERYEHARTITLAPDGKIS